MSVDIPSFRKKKKSEVERARKEMKPRDASVVRSPSPQSAFPRPSGTPNERAGTLSGLFPFSFLPLFPALAQQQQSRSSWIPVSLAPLPLLTLLLLPLPPTQQPRHLLLQPLNLRLQLVSFSCTRIRYRQEQEEFEFVREFEEVGRVSKEGGGQERGG